MNQLPSGKVLAVRELQGRLYVERGELIAAGVRLDAGGEPWVALDSIDQLQSKYQQDSQRLLLTLPSEWLPLQSFGATSLNQPLPAQSSLGLLFNYDLYYSDSGSHYANTWLEQRLFDGFGVISNTGVYRHSFSGPGYQDGYTRYDTSWRFNRQDDMVSYSGGDLVTDALTWNSAVRLGGLQIARNFALRPDLITYPLPRFDGDAAVPSTLDLFIDNSRVSSETLRPGPFTLNTVPYISGAGTATLVTTDALGRQVATAVPFYVTDTLLKQGLFDYSLSAGKLRRDYGLENFSYGSFASSGTLRYGVNDHFTLEGHAEVGDDLRLGGLGGTFGLGMLGTLTSSVSHSQGIGSGQQYSLGYSYYARHFGVTAQRIQRSEGYADLSLVDALEDGLTGGQLSKTSDQLTFTFSPERFGSFGVGYFANEEHDGTRTRLINLSWSKSLWSNSSVYLSFNRQIGESDYSAQAQLVIPFDLLATLSTGIERNSDGDQRARVNYSRSPPSEGGLGWNLGYAGGGGEYRQADMTWRTSKAQLQGGIYQDGDLTTHWGGLSGSLVAMQGQVFASNRIDDAFVVVSTNGYAKVPVRFEHQLLGQTDEHGYLLVPWVPSYYPGQYEIDLLQLPSNVQSGDTLRQIAVHEGSGALLQFDLQQRLAASVGLVDASGTALPRGARVTHQPSGQQTYVGWDGQVYLEGLAEQNSLEVRLPSGATCSSQFALDPKAAEIALIGPLPCLPGGTTP
ncbi:MULTISPECIES: fimbria/pilus outer membrane usher protein [unclassified Pseudomonas]|uniref:fimbria/pilus outer membrane usher protein n=1 Tax=unclassified Pseudomonas TaxID=196821 RepID=UPI00244A79D2|nr:MULTISPECIES: fimbria/pilus outer membrane usher protein [unclassified Pseudomonas]MDG9924072.1 fimbria/pilus outer membrane usher protein [Pseudomonas sp. GD04045]MDH0036502.1 fimbria/pilus outer membrane usher protein [Pseudomonas sp. GD04019]